MRRFLLWFLVICFVSIPCLFGEEQKLKFNRDIRPILSDACFHCHGPDEADRQGGLRLDLEEFSQNPGKSGLSAIVPRDLEESEMIFRIHLPEDDEEHMPPLDSGKSITPEQKKVLERWIKEGAHYEKHWSFEKPSRPSVPVGVAEHPVDSFILRKLQSEGMQLNQPADKETLLRRASLDLIGLPPTVEEIDSFLADDSESAYEQQLDRLLESKHFGERMALEWLDLARYADSNGFQSDGSRDMWMWREWLIGAFNRNLPFDQFTIQQLAGDLLSNPSEDQIIATGFNRNHRLNGEGGRIEEEWFVETVIDRVETTGSTWMALTLTCARCHDHKYDPISQQEFYELFAFFNSVEETGVLHPRGKFGVNTPPILKVLNEEQKKRKENLQQSIQQAEVAVKEAEGSMDSAFEEWKKRERKKVLEAKLENLWSPFENTSAISKLGSKLSKQADSSLLVGGKNPKGDVYHLTGDLNLSHVGALRLEALLDESLPSGGPGRAGNGNFVLTGIETKFIFEDQEKKPVFIEWNRAKADYSQPKWPVENILKNAKHLNRGNASGWAIGAFEEKNRVPREAIFLANKPVAVPKGASLQVSLYHKSKYPDHNIGKFRISLASQNHADLNQEFRMPSHLISLLKSSEENASADQKVLKEYFRENTQTPLKVAEMEIKRATEKLSQFMDKVPSTLVMQERKNPRYAHILHRGEYDQKREKVGRALPAALPPLPKDAPMNRLGFAQWLVTGEHPLTARVWVNRVWERLFGVGIVKTSEDFGSQVEWPSHPDLLDWLAVEFSQPTSLPPVNGISAQAWDMKAMIKFIMLSKTYQQSSSASESLYQKDPDNRLLARGPRLRLPAEIIRDQALAASGLLVPKIGGPSARPYMPDKVWDETSTFGNMLNYKADQGDGLYRRSIYTIWKRTAAPPSMLLFDAPNREICMPKRSRTNTPLQALALMNEVTYVEAARALAEKMLSLKSAKNSEDRLILGYRLATGSSPNVETLSILIDGLDKRRKRFVENPDAAKSLINQGSSTPPSDMDEVELAAYSSTANILLNLDRVIMKN
jgi:hypothetical protein